MDFLSEWGLDEKYKETEIKLIFNELVDVEHDEDEGPADTASSKLFMHRLHEVHKDHPRYNARKAVHRVCQRLLKSARNK